MSATTDTMYHGGGRKSIRHKFPTPEGNIEENVYFYDSKEDPSVIVTTYHDGGPLKFHEVHSEKIIDGWEPHNEA